MYYLLIVFSVLVFGLNFAANDVYRKLCGSSLLVSIRSALIGGVAGLLVLLLWNGFRFEFTPFSFLMALLTTASSISFTFFSFKALEKINLSLYSVFSLLGGMVLPFLQGILFYNEPLTLAKGLCFLLITVAILLPLNKGNLRGGAVYYVGIFIFNGLSGVFSKIFVSAPYEKVSAAGYSILMAVTLVASCLLLLLIFRLTGKRAPKRETPLSFGVCSLNGASNKVANFLLVIALAHVDVSVQYTMITGGTMIVSTLLCFFGRQKPSRRELASVAVAFLGTLVLFVVPI